MSKSLAEPPAHHARIRILNGLRIAFSVAAVALIIFGLFTMREVSRSRGWAETSGRVIASNINQFTNKGTTTYRPLIMYSYAVSGIRFMSSRIAFHSLGSRDRAEATRITARYPIGTSVDVFYDPQNPEQAVLERGGNPWLPIIVGGIFSMFAVWTRIMRGRLEKRPDDRR